MMMKKKVVNKKAIYQNAQKLEGKEKQATFKEN